MNKKSRGIILIYCIILLAMVSILSMGSLELSQMSLKLLNKLEQHNQAMYLAKTALDYAEQRLSLRNKPPCLIDAVAEDYFVSHQIDTTESPPLCQYSHDNHRARYIIEALSQNYCLKFRLSNGKVVQGGEYYRITVLGTVQPQLARVVLQTTYLLPNEHLPSCLGQMRWAVAGRQSWRQL